MRHHAVAVRWGVRCARQVCSCGSQAMPEAQLLGHVVQDHPSCRESGTHVGAAGRKLQTSNAGYIHVAPEQLPYGYAYEPASIQMLLGMRLHSKQHNAVRGDFPNHSSLMECGWPIHSKHGLAPKQVSNRLRQA